MALQYHQPLLNNFMSSGVRYGISGGSNSTGTAVTLFKGTQPTAADILASWTTYNVSALVHWTGVLWLTPPDVNTLTSTKSTTTLPPSATTAFGTGTAEWALLWPTTVISGVAGGVTQVNVLGSTIPSNLFIVVPASGPVGNGVVKVANTSIQSGTSYAPTDITIRMGIS